MPQTVKKAKRPKKQLTNAAIRDLLIPIADFLSRSGISQARLFAEWRSTVQPSGKMKPKIKVVHIGFEHLNSSNVSRWLRDPKYLNHAGRPDDLPPNSERSIASLLLKDQATAARQNIATMLENFGTIKRIAPGKCRLVKRSTNSSIPDYLPFVPNFRFLVDGVQASTWGSGSDPKAPRQFWQSVSSTQHTSSTCSGIPTILKRSWPHIFARNQ